MGDRNCTVLLALTILGVRLKQERCKVCLFCLGCLTHIHPIAVVDAAKIPCPLSIAFFIFHLTSAVSVTPQDISSR